MYCIVDIETTGGNHKSGKITEIAMFKHDGLSVVDSYSTLINPEKSIPYFISNLTGITNDMVADAPKFYEVAKKIIEFMGDDIFIAHNVMFDYNFIREEFKSLGYKFEKERICTVKSARKIFPGLPSYSLGKLCKSMGIPLESHHRAEDDARATATLFEMILQKNGQSHKGLLEKELKYSMMHPSMDKEKLHGITEDTGVYYFLNEQEEIIYVGKSLNIRQRVYSHFRNANSKRAITMINETVDIRTEVTGSELLALLKESEEIKTIKPKYNRQQKRNIENYGLFLEANEDGYAQLLIKRMGKKGDEALTAFKSLDEAKLKLRKWTERFGLCQKHTGLYSHKGPCFAYQVEECRGACISEESPDSYNARVQTALSYLEYQHNSFAIIDEGRTKDENSVVLVKNGCYLGFGYIGLDAQIQSPSEFQDYIEQKMDNRDVKQIIKSYLAKKRIKKLIPFD